ncbi:class I SAM-dependent methyltransferase [Rhodocyclaceae bacterium SMB388]
MSDAARPGPDRKTRFTLPASLKALLAQVAGWAIVILLLGIGAIPPKPWTIVLLQAPITMTAAIVMRSERWWLIIHLVFSPLLLAAHGLGIAAGWYLAGLVALILVYWNSFATRVPLFLSNRQTSAAVAGLLPQNRALRVLDIGSGTGSFLMALAHLRPDCQLVGIESAPAPWLISLVRSRRDRNVRILRRDFFSESWAQYDLIYAFLSPVPMSAVWAKARRELRPGAMLVSNSFPVSETTPARVIDVGDQRATRLFVYVQPDRPG